MKKETLLQANKLQEEYNRLLGHLKNVKDEEYGSGYTENSATISVMPRGRSSEKMLQTEFLPISIPEFMEMYISRVEKRIKQLEKEFEKL